MESFSISLPALWICLSDGCMQNGVLRNDLAAFDLAKWHRKQFLSPFFTSKVTKKIFHSVLQSLK